MAAADATPGPPGKDRKDIARYLLSRGIGPSDLADEPEPPEEGVAPKPKLAIPFPDGLAPQPQPLDPVPSADDPLPEADVVVVTWTVDEHQALCDVLTPGFSRNSWYRYKRSFDEKYRPQIRSGAPSLTVGRLASYLPTKIGAQRVLCVKSELHLNTDGVSDPTRHGFATLPVKDLFAQIIDEAKPSCVLTIGTSGGVYPEWGLGDVAVTRAAKFRLDQEFGGEPFNEQVYTNEWELPTEHLAKAEELMHAFEDKLGEPPVGPPTKRYSGAEALDQPQPNVAAIKLDGRDMPKFHPILTTDFFEYGTTTNRLDQEGAAVEMGDAVLGLLCSELPSPPKWGVVRNMSDPCINGDLPTDEYLLNEQTTWAVAYYTAYGYWTSVNGALATWAIIAGLPAPAHA
jgi:hypothetical protein